MELKLIGLTKRFKNQTIFEDLNFSFYEGHIYALLGRNGIGKTTLFNVIAELLSKDEGEVYLDNQLLDKEDIGLVSSLPLLPDFLTGYEFLKFYCEMIDKPITLIDEWFEKLELSYEDSCKLIKDYSHGMRTKIQMIQILIRQPKIILLDEPLTTLDIIVANELSNIIKHLKGNHIIILSTHILGIAQELCDEIVVLNQHGLNKMSHFTNQPEFMEELIQELKGESNVSV